MRSIYGRQWISIGIVGIVVFHHHSISDTLAFKTARFLHNLCTGWPASNTGQCTASDSQLLCTLNAVAHGSASFSCRPSEKIPRGSVLAEFPPTHSVPWNLFELLLMLATATTSRTIAARALSTAHRASVTSRTSAASNTARALSAPLQASFSSATTASQRLSQISRAMSSSSGSFQPCVRTNATGLTRLCGPPRQAHQSAKPRRRNGR
jgi:hypothetical protein